MMDNTPKMDGAEEMDDLFCKVDFLSENPAFEERLLEMMQMMQKEEDRLLSDEELLRLAAAGRPVEMEARRLNLWENDVNG